jgi:hypothetical protein
MLRQEKKKQQNFLRPNWNYIPVYKFKVAEKMRFSFTNKIALVQAVLAERGERRRYLINSRLSCYKMTVFPKNNTPGAYIFSRKIMSFIQKPIATSPISPIDYW